MSRIAYTKLGRAILLDEDKWQAGGNGDNEPVELLKRLALRHPEHEFVVVGKTSGKGDLPANVTVPPMPKVVPSQEWKGGAKHATPDDMREYNEEMLRLVGSCDGAIAHVGQHGTSNQPIPQDKDPSILTNPQEWSVLYAGPAINAFNVYGEKFEPVYLVQDPRNYLKARDIKWYPLWPILGQHDFWRTQSHYRWGDTRTPEELGRGPWSEVTKNGSWKSQHSYQYAGLELAAVPRWEDEAPPVPWEDRVRFGVLMNENRAYVAVNRLGILKSWVLPAEPDIIVGKWGKRSLADLGMVIQPIKYQAVPSFLSGLRSTITTPASGSEWATAKVWEAFACGAICFIHPGYDTQGHTVPTWEQVREGQLGDELKYLVPWLRPTTPDQLKQQIDAVNTSKETYEWLRDAQYRLLRAARERDLLMTTLDQRLGLTQAAPQEAAA